MPGEVAFYPGQNVKATGLEFAPGSTVILTYDNGTTITSAGTATVGSDGAFTAQVTVPTSAIPGRIAEFQAKGTDIHGGGRYALDVFSISTGDYGCGG